MVGTTIAATREIESDSRRWNLILTDWHGNKLESADGDVISMNHSIEPLSDVLTIGDIFTQNLNIELRRGIDSDGTAFDYEANTVISVAYSLRDTPGIIRMGRYRVKSVEKAKERIRLNLKDDFVNLSEKYTPSGSLTYPAPIIDVMQDICGGLAVHLYEPLYLLDDSVEEGYSVALDKAGSCLYVRSDEPTDSIGDPIELSQAEVTVLSGKKVSEALSICAGLLGCCLVKGRDNALTCVRPSWIPVTVGVDRAADPDFLGEEKMVIGIVCRRSEDDTQPFEVIILDEHGDPLEEGIIIEFENPLMTQNRFDKAIESYLRWGWYMRPATINHLLGDPRLDPMDMISYSSVYEKDGNGLLAFSIPLMSQSFSFDGGLSCTLRATAKYKYKEDENG